MQIQHAILLPPTTLALLTAVVFGRLYKDRIAEIRARRTKKLLGGPTSAA